MKDACEQSRRQLESKITIASCSTTIAVATAYKILFSGVVCEDVSIQASGVSKVLGIWFGLPGTFVVPVHDSTLQSVWHRWLISPI